MDKYAGINPKIIDVLKTMYKDEEIIDTLVDAARQNSVLEGSSLERALADVVYEDQHGMNR